MKARGLEIFFGLAFLAVAAVFFYLFWGKELLQIRGAQKIISSSMYDPDSAQFRNFRVVSNGTVCGEVNGKNRYGAYVGYRATYYSPTREGGIESNIRPSDDDGSESRVFDIRRKMACGD